MGVTPPRHVPRSVPLSLRGRSGTVCAGIESGEDRGPMTNRVGFEAAWMSMTRCVLSFGTEVIDRPLSGASGRIENRLITRRAAENSRMPNLTEYGESRDAAALFWPCRIPGFRPDRKEGAHDP